MVKLHRDSSCFALELYDLAWGRLRRKTSRHSVHPTTPASQEEEQERARREFEAQLEAVSQLDLLQKEERAR